MSNEYIQIQWTCGSLDEARRIGRLLVEANLVACAQIIPWVESVYKWNGELQSDQESKVMLKTRRDLYDQVRQVIEEQAHYEVPEITYVPLAGGNPDYLDWLDQMLIAST